MSELGERLLSAFVDISKDIITKPGYKQLLYWIVDQKEIFSTSFRSCPTGLIAKLIENRYKLLLELLILKVIIEGDKLNN